jgi:flagellar protein FliO/FliZ
VTATNLLMVLPALALVLALAAGAGRLARLLRPALAGPASSGIRVLDRLALDNRRRLTLVRCRGRDVLLLTGGASDVAVSVWAADADPRG